MVTHFSKICSYDSVQIVLIILIYVPAKERLDTVVSLPKTTVVHFFKKICVSFGSDNKFMLLHSFAVCQCV